MAYRLTKPMHAVRVNELGKGDIDELPSGVMLYILGPTGVPGFVEVRSHSELYSVFQEDLQTDRSRFSTRLFERAEHLEMPVENCNLT